ncbi:MAG: Uma2 family endonuclease [Planctomycetes bacterium]|nr:Uma2 family endonuclease [Planctomycetota bacterium]
MATQTRSGPYTFADFLELIREDQKADLLDGVICMASPENIDHNDLVLWLGKVIGLFIEERRLGKVTINRVAYRLSPKNAPEPDLAFVKTERLSIIKPGYVDGAPDLAVEIVSPDSVERDYHEKRRRYEEAGVAEYWIIDTEESRATFLLYGSDGFVEASLQDHIFASQAIPGLVIDTRWLWQRPLPGTLRIVQEMLARAAD